MKITLKGNPVNTIGQLPALGEIAKSFTLVKNDLSEVSLQTYDGKIKVLNIFPSLDTPTCAMSVRKFNQEATKLDNVVVLNISKDLPFAQDRFCAAEGINNTELLSCFRSSFAIDYNVEITDSPLKGLCSRAIIVLNEKNEIIYSEQVPEIADEPDYEKTLSSFNK